MFLGEVGGGGKKRGGAVQEFHERFIKMRHEQRHPSQI